ncbi:MAG: hypothetical protein QXN05_05315 [Acidilobaceae archaeon]
MKRQWVKFTRSSSIAALVSSLIYHIEDSAPNLNPSEVYVYPPLWELEESSSLEVEVYGVDDLEEKRIEIENTGLSITVLKANRKPPVGSASLRELYLALPELVVRLDSSVLKDLSFRTKLTGVEYTIIYALDGRMYVLEGEKGSSPVLPVRVVAILHTHPHGACGFSSRDVRIAAKLLDSFSIFNAVVSDSCIYYLVRVGFLSLDDYLTLLNHSRDLFEELSLSTVKGSRAYI